MYNQILQQFDKEKIRYCLLRSGEDIDISIHKHDWKKIDKIFRSRGFIKSIQNFNKNHRGYRRKGLGFDIRHLDDWNGIFYLDESIYKNKTLTNEDNLIHYICHCLLGKKEWKYKKEILDLMEKSWITQVKLKLRHVFGWALTIHLFDLLKKGKFPNPIPYLSYCILKHPITFSKTFFSWIIWKLKRYPLVAIMGPDGSGKTTAVKNVEKEVLSHKYPIKAIYAGRGRENKIPVSKIGERFKKPKKWMYVPYSMLSFLDLFIRYYSKIRRLRKKYIVITDRSYMDILTMKNIPYILKRVYLLFFPKPTYIFYLYNDIDVLHKRRPEHPIDDLKRQIKIYNRLDSIKIKTINEKNTKEEILKHLF